MKWGYVETVNGDGKSSLLSLVKAFDSVLAVYEGFCNLKQVQILNLLSLCGLFSISINGLCKLICCLQIG